MRIDSHQHFWHYNAARDGWITDEMTELRRDFLPEELIRQMRASGIDGSIAVQADQSETETHFLLKLAESHPEIVGVVGWVDLKAENISERLDYVSHFEKLLGFRHIVQAEPDDGFLLQEDFLRGIKALERHGFTYDILIYERHLPVAAEFVRRFPSQRFIIDHLAKPCIKKKQLDDWARGMRAIAANQNVYCKVSGMVTENDWRLWKEADFKPYLDVVLEAFGADRLMFGSDWPVCLVAASYGQVKDIVAHYTHDLSQSEKEKIFGLNAARFYGVKTAAWTSN
jgi:L-fuconolactonase